MKIKSLIKSIFSDELLKLIGSICDTRRIPSNIEKMKTAIELLKKYKLEFNVIGGATNRLAITVDQYVIKIAIDEQGYTDNLIEFSLSPELQPYVTKTYETNGYIIVAEQVTTMSTREFNSKGSDMISILDAMGNEYLMGDVGYIKKNITNWGVRDDGTPCILDYAYVHRGTENLFTCKQCGTGFLKYDRTFSTLHCSNPACHTKYDYHEAKSIQGEQVDIDMIAEHLNESIALKHDQLEIEINDDGIVDDNVRIIKSEKEYLEYIEEERREMLNRSDESNMYQLLARMARATSPDEKARIREEMRKLSREISGEDNPDYHKPVIRFDGYDPDPEPEDDYDEEDDEEESTPQYQYIDYMRWKNVHPDTRLNFPQWVQMMKNGDDESADDDLDYDDENTDDNYDEEDDEEESTPQYQYIDYMRWKNVHPDTRLNFPQWVQMMYKTVPMDEEEENSSDYDNETDSDGVDCDEENVDISEDDDVVISEDGQTVIPIPTDVNIDIDKMIAFLQNLKKYKSVDTVVFVSKDDESEEPASDKDQTANNTNNTKSDDQPMTDNNKSDDNIDISLLSIDERIELAVQRKFLDKLINDVDYRVREEVARQGYGLDKLVNDESERVRITVARQGYGLDKLVNDKNEYVRAEVAKQRYGLDKLVDDESNWVREEVARQGYGLDKLVNDESERVRIAVARQGYGLDKLVNDKSEWVRAEVAKQRYGLDKLVDDESNWVRFIVAKQGYGWDKLINDPDDGVRAYVVAMGKGILDSNKDSEIEDDKSSTSNTSSDKKDEPIDIDIDVEQLKRCMNGSGENPPLITVNYRSVDEFYDKGRS